MTRNGDKGERTKDPKLAAERWLSNCGCMRTIYNDGCESTRWCRSHESLVFAGKPIPVEEREWSAIEIPADE